MLPDVLEPGLAAVFCGTAAGHESARRGAYYAGRGNLFWSVLERVGLTPRRLEPEEFTTLPRHGLGLTDLVKGQAGMDHELSRGGFDVASFREKVLAFKPQAIGFNGKKAAREALGRRRVDYGRQEERIGDSVVFVLPSTSGVAKRHWDEAHWEALAEWISEAR